MLKWTNHADLFRIKEIAGQFAELLEASGVDTVKEFRHRVAANLHPKRYNRQKWLVKPPQLTKYQHDVVTLMKPVSSKLLFYDNKQERKMPQLW